jgi:23S rRNA (uracil1939-C5)-methyltransferase
MEIRITSPTYGPDGIGRQEDGKVVFVRGGVPGDSVRVSITAEKKSHAIAEIEEILQPSPHRCPAPCPAHPECGGCPWMHISGQTQLDFKREVLLSTLRDVAAEDIVGPVQFHEGGELGYRQRARLQVEGVSGQPVQVGFFSHGTREIVPISSCPVCRPALSRVIEKLASLTLPWSIAGSVEFVMDDDDQVLAIVDLAKLVPDAPGLASALLERAGLAGVAISGPGKQRGRAGMESSSQTTQVDPHCTIPVFPGVFTQANREVNHRLVSHVVALVSELFSRAEVVELYAGHGNFSYPLGAAEHRVLAVESGLCTEFLPRDQRVHFMKGDAATTLKTRLTNRKPDIVLLDPPRQGAKDAIAPLLRLKPAAIVYVSCDPNTFARDGAMLSKRGYTLTEVTPFDMMPHTHHIELVGLFEKL